MEPIQALRRWSMTPPPNSGGNLDVQSFEINTATTNGNITLDPNGTGFVELKGNQDASGTNPGALSASTASRTRTA